MTFVLAMALLTSAQDFEVASVKPAAPVMIAPGPGPKSVGSRESTDAQQIRFTNYTLKRLLMRAYDVKDAQIHGPAWLDDASYDIAATMPEGASKDQIPDMLQHLLTERFRLKLRWETRDDKGYALVAGKNGPRLKASDLSVDQAQVSFDGTSKINFAGFTLTAFAGTLTNLMGRPVSDQTGVQGRFDIALSVSMQDLAGMRSLAQNVAPDDASLSIFTAVQQLGLKLEARAGPIRHLIVESADRVPSGN
jgi:uncharacterized protein (TIGR03435 family)